MKKNKAPLLSRRFLLGEIMRDQELNDSSRRVGYAILDHVNTVTGVCWPSYGCLMDDTRLSRAAVARGVKQLIEKGYLTYVRGGGNYRSQYPGARKGIANRYRPILREERLLRAASDKASVTEDLMSENTLQRPRALPNFVFALADYIDLDKLQSVTILPSVDEQNEEVAAQPDSDTPWG